MNRDKSVQRKKQKVESKVESKVENKIDINRKDRRLFYEGSVSVDS